MAMVTSSATEMIKPVLVFGYGNLSRGDDALGVLLLQQLQQQQLFEHVDFLDDFQLQIEHALDLENRKLVLFVDASVACLQAFDFVELKPAQDKSYTTHAMSPAAVLSVYLSIQRKTPPPCFLLSIQGESFELGDGLSMAAAKHLADAGQFAERLLVDCQRDFWLAQTTL